MESNSEMKLPALRFGAADCILRAAGDCTCNWPKALEMREKSVALEVRD